VDDDEAAIKQSTIGVLSAGTPHRGTDSARWPLISTRLAKLLHKDHSREMLASFKRGSEVLERLQDSFTDISEDFGLYTPLEELEYPQIGKLCWCLVQNLSYWMLSVRLGRTLPSSGIALRKNTSCMATTAR